MKYSQRRRVVLCDARSRQLACMSTAVATERDLHALAADAGLTLSPQLLGVVLELLRLDVTPQAVLMMLRRVMVRSVELQRAPQ